MPSRRTAAATREAILQTATQLFAERGYAGTSVRDIATAAATDPALVIRHFGSKELLFLEAMRPEMHPNPLLEGPIETLGVRFIESLLGSEDQTRGVFLALLRAGGSGPINSRLREVHEQSFVAPLRSRLTGADADLRAREAAAVVGGLLYALWIVGDDVLASAEPAEVARRYGGVLQQLITPED